MICLRLTLFGTAILNASLLSGASPENFIEEVIAARAAFESFEVKVVVKRGNFTADVPEAELLSDSIFDYHFWVDDSIRRVDCSETRPKDPSNAAFQKYARDSEVIRTIPGKGDVVFSEVITEHENAPDAPWIEKHLSIDPMFIGFWPNHFELLKQFSPDEILGLCSGEMTSTTLTERDDQMLLAGMTTSPPSLTWEFQFDPKLRVPTRIKLVGFSGEGVVDTLVTDWAVRKEIALPTSCEFSRTEGDDVTRSENWSMTWVSVNEPIAPEMTSWVALGIQENDVVEFVGRDEKTHKEWANGKFRDWQPRPLIASASNPVPTDHGLGRKLVIGCNLLVIGAVLSIYGYRRLRNRPR